MITLLGRVYRLVSLDGVPTVIRKSGARQWRVAAERERVRVIAGLSVCALRVVS